MLEVIGLGSIEGLFADVPKRTGSLRIKSLPERKVVEEAEEKAVKERRKPLVGSGCYNHYAPYIVDWVSELPGFLTPYTPYQPEISQGILRALFEYQSLMCELFGMDVSNAGMYGVSSALAEAALMSSRITGERKIFVSCGLNPFWIEVLTTYAKASGLVLELVPLEKGKTILPEGKSACLIVQNPNFFGCPENLENLSDGMLVVAVPDPVMLTVLERPGKFAKIAVGEGQPLGNHPFFGGATLGIFTAKEELLRKIPGRLVGETKDIEGRTCYALVLQTREQHIRREKATSNICTATTLFAIRATVFIYSYGFDGLKEIAEKSCKNARRLAEIIGKPIFEDFVNEFAVRISREKMAKIADFITPPYLSWFAEKMRLKNEYLEKLSFDPEDVAVFCTTEILDDEDFEKIERSLGKRYSIKQYFQSSPNCFNIPKLSEAEIARKFYKLSKMNFCIEDGFYPLGSCTMKYNPKVNEKVVRMFAEIHPYEEHQGILKILWEFEKLLCEICGMDAFSLHPSAGAHGELLSLMMAKRYFEDKGEKERKVVLLPDSAHGTNPASASMSGFSIREIKSDERGNTDIEDIKMKLDNSVAVFMLTYPNTLGLADERIIEIAELVHSKGALLYLDGANLNALLGIVKPGELGFDFIHVNLHKTFSSPHGGGGPGAGPLGVKSYLKDYLPVPKVEKVDGKFFLDWNSVKTVGKIETFWGNVPAIIRSWAYIKMLGGEGLRQVAERAVLNANYLMAKLSGKFHIPYKRLCKHEFVISEKGLPVRTEDFAKRLQDFGFHPPTIYFPLVVKGAMMIEPTETETKETLDKFIEAMERILEEARENPERLKQAPFSTPVRRIDLVLASHKLKLKCIPSMNSIAIDDTSITKSER